MQTAEMKKDYAVAVLDPAGNVTALVLSDVPAAERAQVAARLLRLPEDVLNAMRNAGLTERHGRALLRLETPQEQREALAYILSRDLNVAATDAYIERLLEAKTAPESEQQKTFILKDVRVFLNTIPHSLDLMKQGGIDAGMRRQETDEALILTINIPKARRREPAPKQAEPVPVG